jgi:excisionase family DNA binding protein
MPKSVKAVTTMRLLSVKEAAELLGVSGGLIYALCARKRIRHERYGLGRGTIKIPEDAIEEYRRSVTVGGDTALETPRQPVPIKLKHLSL